ncbi:hypothetical protein DFH27DRAFT_207185 [Peziza echinospora]|nr:hypothetical protein DFH27DRAFT_207185 [Peziza echinospora]
MNANTLALRDMHDSSAPDFRPTFMDRSILLMTWWCSISALVIVLVRVIGRYCRTLTMYRDDRLMLASILPLALRLGLAHLVLRLGTNNINLDGFDKFTTPKGDEEVIEWGLEKEISRREMGSKIVLVSRLAYVAFIWSQMFCITEFHKKLNLSFRHQAYKTGLNAIRWSLVVTFVAIMIAVLAECNPFPHFWQVSPDPGPKCRRGNAPLIATAVCSSATNLIIALFPLPAVLMSKLKLERKILLTCSLSLSLIPAALAIYRVPFVLSYNSSQGQRSLYASFECLASCVVANAIVLNAMVRGKGPQRNKFRGPGGADMIYTPEQLARRGRDSNMEDAYALQARRVRGGMEAAWGSDEDLVKGVGMGLPHSTPNGELTFNRQSAVTESSGGSLDAGCGGPTWSHAWEDGAEAWMAHNGTDVGRDLILPPAPAALPSTEWRDRPNVGYNTEESRSTAELWKPSLEPAMAQKGKLPSTKHCLEPSSKEIEAKGKRKSLIDVGCLLKQKRVDEVAATTHEQDKRWSLGA